MVRNGRSVGSAREEAGEGGCYMCSVEELEMRLEDWIWRNERRGEDLQVAYLLP